jgi:putative protein-disulfide isomerase
MLVSPRLKPHKTRVYLNAQALKNNKVIPGRQQSGSVIDITVYTDPLCCWSWGAAPHWEQLRQHLATLAKWSFRMGGLLPSWKEFLDEVQSVTRPAQMGPVWMHASQLINRPINTRLWHLDPPASSYPACVAVKAAGFQSEAMGSAYFALAQRACMQEGRNIAKPEVLLELAEELASGYSSFDCFRFEKEYRGDEAMDAFREDLLQTQYYRITRLPTLVVHRGAGHGLVLSGFKPFEELARVVDKGFI